MRMRVCHPRLTPLVGPRPSPGGRRPVPRALLVFGAQAHCENASIPVPKTIPSCKKGPDHEMDSGITMLSTSASTPAGPWVAHGRALNGSNGMVWDTHTTNPAPYALPNGSVYLAYRGCESGCKGQEMIGVAAADAWGGPYAITKKSGNNHVPGGYFA